MEEVDPTELIS